MTRSIVPKKNSPFTAVLLINLGTPDAPAVRETRRYLRQFLMDPRVLDIPWISRFFLVNGIIAPFRSPSSSVAYQRLWRKEGSPLKVYGFKTRDALSAVLPDHYQVFLAMRYQHPGIPEILRTIAKAGFEHLIIIPLFPQYASASSGSAIEEALRVICRWTVIPHIRVVSQFFDHPLFKDIFVERAARMLEQTSYDGGVG